MNKYTHSVVFIGGTTAFFKNRKRAKRFFIYQKNLSNDPRVSLVAFDFCDCSDEPYPSPDRIRRADPKAKPRVWLRNFDGLPPTDRIIDKVQCRYIGA